MYGKGNYDHRPMPPYQQHLSGPQHPGPHFQVPPRPSGYLQPPPFPQNLGQQAPPVSMPINGNSFMHPQNLHSGLPFQSPYPAAQQNYGTGMQNPNHALSPPPPPPPSSLCPPPPPVHGQVVYGARVPQSVHNTLQGIHHMPLQPPMRLGGATSFLPSNFESAKQPMNSELHSSSMAPPPPPLPVSSPPMPPPPPSGSSPPKPPPPPSCSSPSSMNAVVSTSMQSGYGHGPRGDLPSSNEHLLPRQNVVVDLPPPPPKPVDETLVRNIEILCQYIAKNGPDLEDTACQNGTGKPEFIFLFGGEPGSQASCAREYYLWMKKKYGLVGDMDLSQGNVGAEHSENLNSVPAEGTACSPMDSDVDMEDDVAQSEKELGVYNSGEDLKLNSVSTEDMHEMHEQNDVQLSTDSSLALDLSQMPEQRIEPEQSVQMNAVDSPIKLIQNYSSDGSSDDSDDDVACNGTPMTMVELPPCKHQPTSHSDMVNDNITLKCGQVSEPADDDSPPAYNESALTKGLDKFETVECGAPDKIYEIPSREKSASCPSAAIQGNYALENNANYSYEKGSSIDSANLICKETLKEKENKNTSKSEVDEFGRLVKEGGSESESEDFYLVRRRYKRGRSRSCSRSPSDRRRSPRWSPHRRKDKRSRSPRSRSPYRHADLVGKEKPRRGKAQMPECFDFLKGQSFRGDSCRYLHHEADKNESLRLRKSKQHQPESMVSSRNSGLYGGDGSSRLCPKVDVVKDEKCDLAGLASKSNDEIGRVESIHETLQKGEASTVEDPQFEEVTDQLIYQENTNSGMPSTNEQENHQSEAEASAQPCHRVDSEPLKMDSASKVDSSTIQAHAVPSDEVHISVSEPYPGNVSNMPAGPGDLTSQPLIPHIPPPGHLLPQATNAPQGSKLVDHKSMVPAVGFPPQPAPVGNVPAYQAPLSNQQSQYSTPPDPMWGFMPQMHPRPMYMSDPCIPGPPLHFQQFQQGNLSMRNDFPSHSQVGSYQHQPYNLHLYNLPTQPFGGVSLVRDDRYSQFPSQGVPPSSSFASPSVPVQSTPFPGDSTVKTMLSFPPGDSLASNESSKPTFQDHSYSQQGPPSHGLQLPAGDSSSSRPGNSLSVSGYSSAHPDWDSSHFVGIGGSLISAHYNPYASTFDQPLTTRFSSAAFTQDRVGVAGIKYDGSVGKTSSDDGSKKLVLSPNSSKAWGKSLPKSAGDQYDPLFDSIEPSSESFKKHVRAQDHVADNSDKLKKLSHYKVQDVEENNKKKEIGVAATMSPENDEFGETADAEVGAVENGSPSEPDEDAIVAEGEIEIDQVKSEGKTKKSKDSRSMKLFKIAVANFVKEVLKPQWRQGNMSKEVFKTIVKKTVDKVSGAMKNHRIPKSQEKIDHYIDSSRRKLTQLVEGYVSKYKS